MAGWPRGASLALPGVVCCSHRVQVCNVAGSAAKPTAALHITRPALQRRMHGGPNACGETLLALMLEVDIAPGFTDHVLAFVFIKPHELASFGLDRRFNTHLRF